MTSCSNIESNATLLGGGERQQKNRHMKMRYWNEILPLKVCKNCHIDVHPLNLQVS
jgi:hypothetical protein